MIKNLFPVPLPAAIVVRILRYAALRSDGGMYMCLPISLLPMRNMMCMRMIEGYRCGYAGYCGDRADFMQVLTLDPFTWYRGLCTAHMHGVKKAKDITIPELWLREPSQHFCDCAK